MTHPDGVYFSTIFDQVDRAVNATWTNGPDTVAFMTITFANHGLRSNFNIASSWTAYGYDPIGRLTSMPFDFVGTAADVTYGYSYNPASQMVSLTRDNDDYAWTGAAMVNRAYAANGLNQYTQSGSITPTYDVRGNLISAGPVSYAYDSQNMLRWTSDGITFHYDPFDRLVEYDTTVSTRFVHDGAEISAEVDNPAGAILRRYVRGDGADELIAWYEGSGTSDRRFLSTDERGSIVSVTDASGALLAINSYDEYGIPGSGNVGRFQYTGQAWLPELGMYHYKNRIYSPTLGRFLQTDPIGTDGGINLYAYVTNDPVNFTDPLGLSGCSTAATVCGRRDVLTIEMKGFGHGATPFSADPDEANEHIVREEDDGTIVVPGKTKPKPTKVAQNRVTIDLPPNGPGTIREDEKTEIACGVMPDGKIGCGRVSYEYLCSGASQRLNLIAGTAAGKELLKSKALKGLAWELLMTEAIVDAVDYWMYCE